MTSYKCGKCGSTVYMGFPEDLQRPCPCCGNGKINIKTVINTGD